VRSIALPRALLVLGILVVLPSIWKTLSFSWDPTFQAPALRYGPTHSNYHAFREFTLTLGAPLVMLWAILQPPARSLRELWVALAGLFYFGGCWLPWRLLGLHTLSLAAELHHEAAALLLLVAIGLAWWQVGMAAEVRPRPPRVRAF